MGMNLATGALPGADPEPIVDVNTTPLIDVMLVLLVMLIITIPIQLHSVNLNLPVGKAPAAPVQPEVVRIDIDAHGSILWNASAVADRDELKRKLQVAAAQPVPPEVHVRPSSEAKYERFVEVMIAANQAGVNKLGVVGNEQFIDP